MYIHVQSIITVKRKGELMINTRNTKKAQARSTARTRSPGTRSSSAPRSAAETYPDTPSMYQCIHTSSTQRHLSRYPDKIYPHIQSTVYLF